MGDRVTIQLTKGKEFSPIIYMHWAGEAALEILKEAAPLMRKGDMSYAFARLAGACHNATEPEQGLSFGIWNADSIVTEDSQGDNGHFGVDISTGEVTHYGGYEPAEGAEIENLALGEF